MNKEFYYRLDIAASAIVRRGKELAKGEEELQEWLKDYLTVITAIEKYLLDLKEIWGDPKADEGLKKLEGLESVDNLEGLEKALKSLKEELSEVYNRYLGEVIASRGRK